MTSAEVPNTKLLCIVGFILICSMDHFGNIHIYIGHEMKWIQFKIKKNKFRILQRLDLWYLNECSFTINKKNQRGDF